MTINTATATATANAHAWQQGWQDYLAGVHANPYDINTRQHTDWWCGYSHAEQTYAETQHLEPSHA